MTMLTRFFTMLAIVAMVLASVGCGDSGSTESGSSASSGGSAERVKIIGAGASFPAPLYQQWFKDYHAKYPNVQIDYQAVGSGSGIKQFIAGTTDFGASDAAMNEEEQTKVDGGVYLLPMTAGAVVLAYNLPGVDELKLPQDVYPQIFLGKITKWNDPKIAKANSGVKLPDLNIRVVRRADSSGTTFVFTKHLAAINSAWKNGPGVGKSIDWPTGEGAPKNAGVAAKIKQTPGAVGYIEYGYSLTAGLPTAALENKSGNYIKASEKSGAAALASAELPDDLVVWVSNPAGKDAYPIVTFTWILAHTAYSPEIGPTLKKVLEYGLTEGQKISSDLGYLPLPEEVTSKVMAKVKQIKIKEGAAH